MKKVKPIDLTNLIRPYAKENLWIALNTAQDKVIASGKTIKEALDNAKKISNEKPVLMQAVQDYSAYILGY